MVPFGSSGIPLVVRVTAVETLEEAECEEAIGHHCYRGQLTPSTRMYLTARGGDDNGAAADLASEAVLRLQISTSASGASSMSGYVGNNGGREEARSGRTRLRLINARSRPSRACPPANVLDVTTSDGEWFPVKKKLLRPCIALTKVMLPRFLGHDISCGYLADAMIWKLS